jgi:3-hydroxyisobutyrate dehydrogenase-like beta-hydroxyacid dehydrogenase
MRPTLRPRGGGREALKSNMSPMQGPLEETAGGLVESRTTRIATRRTEITVPAELPSPEQAAAVRAIAAPEKFLAVVSTIRADGGPHASLVNAGLLPHPVTGATVGAENATLTIMIGAASAEDFERARDVLRLCGKTIIHAGAVGAGHAIKVLTNSIMGATVWMTSECLLLAKRYGVDLKTAFAITNAGSGRSNASENLLPMRLLDGKWPLVFKLAHHDKDIRIAASIAHQQHASTPMLALTQQLFTAALNELGDKADYIEVAKVIAKWNATEWT